jgi:hypothetical protein
MNAIDYERQMSITNYQARRPSGSDEYLSSHSKLA